MMVAKQITVLMNVTPYNVQYQMRTEVSESRATLHRLSSVYQKSSHFQSLDMKQLIVFMKYLLTTVQIVMRAPYRSQTSTDTTAGIHKPHPLPYSAYFCFNCHLVLKRMAYTIYLLTCVNFSSICGNKMPTRWNR